MLICPTFFLGRNLPNIITINTVMNALHPWRAFGIFHGFYLRSSSKFFQLFQTSVSWLIRKQGRRSISESLSSDTCFLGLGYTYWVILVNSWEKAIVNSSLLRCSKTIWRSSVSWFYKSKAFWLLFPLLVAMFWTQNLMTSTKGLNHRTTKLRYRSAKHFDFIGRLCSKQSTHPLKLFQRMLHVEVELSHEHFLLYCFHLSNYYPVS